MAQIVLEPSSFWWGRRAGMFNPNMNKRGYLIGLIIRLKRGGLGRGTPRHKRPRDNQGGKSARVMRRTRKYANPKLWRRHGLP